MATVSKLKERMLQFFMEDGATKEQAEQDWLGYIQDLEQDLILNQLEETRRADYELELSKVHRQSEDWDRVPF